MTQLEQSEGERYIYPSHQLTGETNDTNTGEWDDTDYTAEGKVDRQTSHIQFT